MSICHLMLHNAGSTLKKKKNMGMKFLKKKIVVTNSTPNKILVNLTKYILSKVYMAPKIILVKM